MSVGTFLQPDFEAQSGTVYKTAIDGAFAVLSRIGAMFAPHEQDTPDMTVRLDAGALLTNGGLGEIAAQNTGTITAPAGSDHRIDRVVIDVLTGAVSVITGTPGELPRTTPAIPTGKLPICQVALAHGMTVITNDLITDERVIGAGVQEAFPVNSVHSNLGASPAGILGYGTWSLIDALGASKYPPAYSADYVKATSEDVQAAHIAANPSIPLIGTYVNRNWLSNQYTNQRLHIALGTPLAINRIYYENYCSYPEGDYTTRGAKDFTFWGSNNAAAFAELTYGSDTNWTQLACNISQLVKHHYTADTPDPQYVAVTNTVAYCYYAFKFANTWGDILMGMRRIELQAVVNRWQRTA